MRLMHQVYRTIASRPLAILLAFPFGIGLLWTLGPLLTETIYTYSGVVLERHPGPLGVVGNIEPNIGITSFALGARAALDIWAGQLPLWNPYQGFGAPLLGEMQSAAFFPFTWLLALPHGQAIAHAALQLVAGVGMYLFLRSLGLSKTAAITGAMLYQINGVYAWLRNAIFNPVAFLPWLMLVVEQFYRFAQEHEKRWLNLEYVCLGGAMGALALYAGFPEQVYLYTLLIGVWAAFRATQLKPRAILGFTLNLFCVALLTLACSAPVLTAFAFYLPDAHLGLHEENGFYGAFPHFGATLQYILPYVFGPIFGTSDPRIAGGIWSSTGGYIGFSPVILALGALCLPQSRYRAPVIVLFLWIVVALGTSHGLPGLYEAFMAIPLANLTASFRYLNASWIFAVICMAAIFIDQAPRLVAGLAVRTLTLAVCSGMAIALGLAYANSNLISDFWLTSLPNRPWIIGAAGVAVCVGGAILLFSRLFSTAIAIRLVCAISILELALWFLIPYLGNPSSARIDEEAIQFLRDNVGHQRVMSMRGIGIQPNYGSYFEIATLNYNDLPVPAQTVNYIREELDPHADYVFDLSYPERPHEQQEERFAHFRNKLPAYAFSGVKYVLAGPAFLQSFEEGDSARPQQVFSSPTMTVYELQNVRSYFSASGCRLEPETRQKLTSICAADSDLTRLELFMPGWSVSINGSDAIVEKDADIFQKVALPAGRSSIIFRYSPPYFFAAAWIAAVAISLVTAFGIGILVRRVSQSA